MTILPKVKLKTLVSFPASVRGGTGINVTQDNGVYTFNLDYSEIAPAADIPPDAVGLTYIVTWNYTTNTFQTISIPDAAGVIGIPQNVQSANYVTVADDAQKHIFHPSADTTARAWTIASNAIVAYPIGTAITFVNQNGAGIISLAAAGTDVLRLAGPGTTGTRSLAANGVATALKITITEWIISGTGLT